MWVLAIVWILSLFVLLLFLQNYRTRQSFESKGILYKGNGFVRLFVATFRSQSFIDDIYTQYKMVKAAGVKVTGGIDFGRTTLVISDPDLLKSILVKNFDHFSDRRTIVTGSNDYLFSKMLFPRENTG